MKGYLNNPAATANAITKDGWFKSGDIAIRDDDGFFYIIDRKKELIKYKGCVEGRSALAEIRVHRHHLGSKCRRRILRQSC